jgi:hypothetical protein
LALKVSSLILPWKNTLHESSLTGSLNLKTWNWNENQDCFNKFCLFLSLTDTPWTWIMMFKTWRLWAIYVWKQNKMCRSDHLLYKFDIITMIVPEAWILCDLFMM